MSKENLPGHIRWKCYRRGMLELDILLERFFENHYAALSEQEKQQFAALLETEDTQLFAWLMGHEAPTDAVMLAMVERVRTAK